MTTDLPVTMFLLLLLACHGKLSVTMSLMQGSHNFFVTVPIFTFLKQFCITLYTVFQKTGPLKQVGITSSK